MYSCEQVSAVQTRSATKGQAEPASTRGAQLEEKQGQTDEVTGLGEINWTKEQNKDKDVSTVKSWLKNGEKQTNDIELASPALRSYFANSISFVMIADNRIEYGRSVPT